MSSVLYSADQSCPGVETIGENEMIDYLEQMSAGDDSILVIDSRTPNWVERGQIPGAINLLHGREAKHG